MVHHDGIAPNLTFFAGPAAAAAAAAAALLSWFASICTADRPPFETGNAGAEEEWWRW